MLQVPTVTSPSVRKLDWGLKSRTFPRSAVFLTMCVSKPSEIPENTVRSDPLPVHRRDPNLQCHRSNGSQTASNSLERAAVGPVFD
jgi:hypothetical protein